MTLQEMRAKLWHGDVSNVAKECGVSTQTVRQVLFGRVVNTYSAILVTECMELTINQREERTKVLNQIKEKLEQKDGAKQDNG